VLTRIFKKEEEEKHGEVAFKLKNIPHYKEPD
jgi:hypothetical protein